MQEEMFQKTVWFVMAVLSNIKYRKHLHISNFVRYTRGMKWLSHNSTWAVGCRFRCALLSKATHFVRLELCTPHLGPTQNPALQIPGWLGIA